MPKPNVREKIVAAGLVQFYRVGFNACSVEDITTFAGVPKGSFYNHFKSKELLALEVMERYREAGIHQSLVEKNGSAPKRLKDYFAFLAKNFTDADFSRGCLYGNFANELADHSPLIRERLKANFAGWTEALATVIRDGQAAGEIPSPQKPEKLAGALISAWEGTLIRARCTREPATLKEFSEVTLPALLK